MVALLTRSKKLSSLAYVALMFAASGLAMVKGIIFAKLLGKVGYGQYSMVVLSASYLAYAFSFGLHHGLIREGSMAVGKGELSEVVRMRNYSVMAALLSALIYGFVGAVIFYCVLPKNHNHRISFMLSIFLATSILEFKLFSIYLRVMGNATKYAFFMFLRNGAIVLLAGMGTMGYGFETVVIAESCMGLFFCVVIFLSDLDRRSFRLPEARFTDTIKTLVKIGFPFMCNEFILNLMISVDRWFVAFSLDAADFGEYAFAMIALNVGISLLTIVTLTLGPKWIALYSATGSLNIVFCKINKVSLLIGVSLIVSFVPVYLFLPFIIESFFPDFADVYPIILIVYAGVIFYMVNLYEWVFKAIGQGTRLLVISSLTFVVVLLSCAVGTYLQQGLVYFASMFVLGRIINLLFMYVESRKMSIAQQHYTN